MYNKQIAYKVKNLLSHNRNKQFKIKDIAKELRSRRHQYRDLKDTLLKLTKDESIVLTDRKYSHRGRIANNLILDGKFDARTLAKNKSFAFVITNESDIYISSEDTLNAYHDDIVSVEIKYSRFNKRYGIIRKIVKRAKCSFVGTIYQIRHKYRLIPDNSKIHTDLDIHELSGAKPGQKVVLEITNWGNRDLMRLPSGKVIEILGTAGEPEIEIISVIKQYDLPLSFPEKVLNELKMIDSSIQNDELTKRIDLRNLTTFTIDPVSAKDFDDAVSLEKTDNGWKLYVHIADVAHYVKVGSELFKEAVKRGNSYYFPKKVIPMLPEKISNNICSLRPFEDKLTITVITHFSNNYHILSQEIHESVIRSDQRFSYSEIDDFFDKKELSLQPEIAEILSEMKKLSSSLSETKIRNGYLTFNLPEAEFIFDENGKINDIKRSRETESHKMIENFMLIANEFVAKELSKQKTIYRIHEEPDEENIKKLIEIADKNNLNFEKMDFLNRTYQKFLGSFPEEKYHRVLDRQVLRTLKKAKYDTKNAGHFGLALSNYTHFTSPIRRICDLVVHHQLKQKIHSKEDKFSGKELVDLAKIASEREIIADESEREMDLKNKLSFMKTKLGETFGGIIIGIRSSSLLVELDEFPIVGVVEYSTMIDDHYEYFEKRNCLIGRRTGKKYQLMDTPTVSVIKVTDDIYFSII